MRKISYILQCTAMVLFLACGNTPKQTESETVAVDPHAGHNHAEIETEHDHDHEEHGHEAESDNHDPKAEHEHSEDLITLTPEKAAEAGIVTANVESKPFSEIIPATGKIMPMQGDLVAVTAKTEGFVLFSNKKIVSGSPIGANEKLMIVTTAGITQENYSEQVAQAEIDHTRTKDLYERSKLLFDNQLVTAKDLQDTKAAYDMAALKLKNLKKGFESDGLAVTSPIGGYVTDVYVGEGDYVSRGQTLFTVSKNRNVMLLAEVSPEYTQKLPRVTSANFRTSASGEFFSIKELGGSVTSYGRSVSKETLLVPIYFSVPYNGKFATGSFAEIKLLVNDGSNNIVIPQTALVEDFGNFFVYIADSHGYEKRDVEIGGNDGKFVKIESGLKEGETVVIKGAARLKLIERLKSGSGEAAAHAGHSH